MALIVDVLDLLVLVKCEGGFGEMDDTNIAFGLL